MKKNFFGKLFGLTLLMFTLLFTGASAETYEGTGLGYDKDGIVLDVEITNNKIVDVKVKRAKESEFATPAIQKIAKKVIATQSLDVDGVSGATITSEGTKEALEEAVKKSGVTLTAVTIAQNTKAIELPKEADVVVIGAGGAGLTSAIAAHEKGVKVILVEKTELLGGNTNYATAGLNAAGTKIQEKLGIKDSPELFYEDTMKGGKNKNNKELVRVLVNNSSAIVDWLTERGADLSELTSTGGQSVKRTHRPTGGSAVGPNIVAALSKTAESEKIDIRKGTKAIALVKAKNKIVGVKVREIDGKEYTIKAKAVIVATGGFGANAKMVEKYNPKLKGFGSTNNPAIVGDGIIMVEKVGGALVDMSEIQTHPTVVHNKTNMITEAVRGEGAILVNRDGKRFIDELETRDVVSKAILNQKGKSAFLIFDEGIRTKLKAADGYVKKGFAVEGTLEEIAAKIGTDAKTLEATLNKYNEAVRNKVDSEFNKKTLPKELTGTKYYAIEVSPAVHHTMGGVRINTNAEVLGKNGRPIKGLYAAGEVTGGIHGANRIGGNAVADITIFGKIAGENAAIYSKSVK
ncbi:flavocytochrome c [Fusobacterium animalis 7_1]|uniref:Urocanate reductase n=3 Tax=Fusobacteriaceae TaxID=203492 RepID=A0A140PU41_9FUSO|nr:MULTISPECIES: flavocytochrome c [Fusobacterium]EEO43710.2 flavocytochrome c [Fusobacterium animalis 7_1]EHG17968.2 flavocytochrome c [Fusobacterium polymorphum F0401]ERT41672.1 fumarate reductase flavoprotein subunit [Fusobacterium nucleatum CTI-1]